MSTMTPNIRRKSGDLDVYTGLLLATFLVLVAGVVALYTSNTRQVDGLSQQKDAIRADREIVSACMRQIQLLRTHVAEHINSSQRVTDELRRILEPTQVATFLLWVERNQRSMNLLNSIVATDSAD